MEIGDVGRAPRIAANWTRVVNKIERVSCYASRRGRILARARVDISYVLGERRERGAATRDKLSKIDSRWQERASLSKLTLLTAKASWRDDDLL